MLTTSRRALILTHVTFEGIGSLEAPLRDRGFSIETINVASVRFPVQEAESCDLLVVMGGPIGVYDQRDFPFLQEEITCIRKRLDAHSPTLGICLGAQLMAAALGAHVYPGDCGAEIGWSPIQAAVNPGAQQVPPWFLPLLAPELHLLHWHGDTFDLPEGCFHLAKSERYINQAFAVGNYALALQFHPEVTESGMEQWYVGHSCELRHAAISIPSLRAATQKYAPALQEAAGRFWALWLDSIF